MEFIKITGEGVRQSLKHATAGTQKVVWISLNGATVMPRETAGPQIVGIWIRRLCYLLLSWYLQNSAPPEKQTTLLAGLIV